MRVKIRRALNVDAPVNLRRLSPVMKIYAGIMSKYHSSSFYKQKLNARLEEAAIHRMQRDERLKEALLTLIYRELISNTTLKQEGKICKSIVVSIEATEKNSLDRVSQHNDFLSYNFKQIEENHDLRLAFPDMPYLIEISKKIV